jgi:5-methylcytosine-specific restriction endonuclease McrA
MTNPYASIEYRRNRRATLEAAGYRCQMVAGCTARATTVDHVVPLARGGTHDLRNLRAACWSHNSAGGARLTNQGRALRNLGRRSRPW